jgi:hypothetical protein
MLSANHANPQEQKTRDNDKIRMMTLEGMTNDQMMAKRFSLLTLQPFNDFTLQHLIIRRSSF